MKVFFIMRLIYRKKYRNYYTEKKIRLIRLLKKSINLFSSALCFMVCLYCFIHELPEILGSNSNEFSTAVAGLVMPDGAKNILLDASLEWEEKEESRPVEAQQIEEKVVNENVNTTKNSKAVLIETCSDTQNIIPIAIPNIVPAEGENVYSVTERNIANEGDSYENVFVKNYSKTPIDIASELSENPELNFNINSEEPQILIYHTHTTESYMPSNSNVFPASYYSRTTEKEYSVAAVGENICKQLQKRGISVVHDTTIHDNPSYNGSYYRSEDTIHTILEKYPSIVAAIDIHRDAIGSTTNRSKTVFDSKSGKAAQIMIICGCGENGVSNFPDWRQNLRFGLKIQKNIADNYPGMARSLKFCDRQYNLNATKGSILIEVGTDVNTLEEALKSGEMLGDAIADVVINL